MNQSIVTLIAISIICPMVYAGVGMEIKCSSEKCGFKSEFLKGRGKRSTIIPGYCLLCKKMVSAKFKRGEAKPLVQVWSSKTGEILDLYECPHCKKPFAEAKKIIFCPKCNQRTISTKRTLKWD